MKKVIFSVMVASIIGSTFLPAISVSAEEVSTEKVQDKLNERKRKKQEFLNLSDRDLLVKVGKFNEEDLKMFTNEDISSMANQVRFDIQHSKGNYIGASKATKLIAKGWKKLPKGVKKVITSKVGSLGALLDTIDHFTGTMDSMIYKGLRKAGFSKMRHVLLQK